MSKHTPGPWTRGHGNHVYQGKRHDPCTNQRLIAICEPGSRTQADWDQVWANAQLIAAAPELLSELETLVEYMTLAGYDETDDTARLPGAQAKLASARAVIRKIKEN